jgi:hypothetical protein
MPRRIALAALIVLAGCAGARPEVVDAVTGDALAATVRELPDGRLIIERDGYEMWAGPATATRVALRPLWQTRFLDEGRGAPRTLRPPPSICCPGSQAR